MFRIAFTCLLVCTWAVRTIAQNVWQEQASGTTSTLRGVAYGIGQFVAVGDSGTILTSPDGAVWSKRTSGTDQTLCSVAWGADSYVAVGDGGIVLKSPDAVTWFPVIVKNAAPDWRLNGVSYWSRSGAFGDMFFAVGEDGLIVTTGYSGVWTGRKEPSARWALRGVFAERDYTYAVGQQGLFSVNSVLYDLDGGVSGTMAAGELDAITQGADRIVAVGRGGSVWIKGIGVFGWSKASSGASGDLFGVTFFDGFYVAVGANGAIWQARDPSARWTSMASATAEDLHAVAAGANAVVAVGERGTILSWGLPVSGAPVILVPPAAAASLTGGMAGFVVKAGGAPQLRYQWLRDGQSIAGATARVLVVPVVGATDAGRYSVRVENEFGTTTSPAAPLAVGPAPATPIVDARFRADARLDLESPEASTGILPLPDGRVLIGFSGNGQSRLLRLQADGQIDPLFLANAPSPLSLHKVQPDGRLLVSGRLTALATSASALFRVMDDGTVDPSFDPLASEDFVRQTLLQPDGKIVVSTGNGQVFRLMSNGQLDSAFQPFTINGQYGAMALAPDGKIYRAIPYGGLKRFLNDGRPDPVFVPPYLPSDAGSKGFQMLTAPAGRILVDYQTWNGTGGTSVSWVTGSIQILPDGSTRGGRSGWLSRAVAPDGTLISTYGDPTGNPIREPPYFAIESSYGAAPLPMNWGVAVPSQSYVAAFGPDNELWVGGSFSFYNGVRSPRIVRLNRATSEVAAPPVLLGTWAESATIPSGGTVTIHAAANSDGPVTYEWNLNGDAEWIYSYSIRRTVAPTLSFQPAAPGPWRWAVRARNSAGASVVAIGSAMVAPPPFIVTSIPSRVSAHSGRDATLAVTVPSVVAVTNATWRRDSVPLPPANVKVGLLGEGAPRGTAYALRSVSVADAGAYTVTLTRSNGQTIEVGPIIVTVDDIARISNFSVRAWVGLGEQSAIAGFAVPAGSSARQLLVRGVGPALGAFGVPGALVDPKIELFASRGSIGTNDDWNESSVPASYSAGEPGAFPLPARSRDAALFTKTVWTAGLGPGVYTVQLTGKQNTTGTGLLELYEADNVSDRLANFSARAYVRPNENIIAGFAVRGSVNLRVLIRAAGPAMSAFGVAGVLLNPRLELRDASGRLVAANDDWQGQTDAASMSAAAASVGAFVFAGGSKDAALLLTLPPANYSAIVTGTGSESGVALIEIYEVQ